MDPTVSCNLTNLCVCFRGMYVLQGLLGTVMSSAHVRAARAALVLPFARWWKHYGWICMGGGQVMDFIDSLCRS
jgi:hypothetical protein